MEITKCCSKRSYYVVDHLKICSNPECLNYLAPVELEIKKEYTASVYLFVVVLLLFFPIHDSESFYRVEPIRIKEDASVRIHKIPATLENVLAEIRKLDIVCAEQVYAQIKLESANLNSFLFKRTNNMLGMRYPYRRSTTAVGIYLPEQDTIVYGNQKELLKYRSILSYAVYASWNDAVKDYKLWQDQTFNVEQRYLDFLRKNYAEDPNYISKITVIADRAKE